jgi:tripartite-type tricarboxylate transporter receptor subunit TctC
MNRFSPSRRRIALFGAVSLALAALALPVPAVAQVADKPLRIILAVSAGSGVDTITRAVQGALAKELGRAVMIENLPGAGGITGTHALVKSPADGSTISVVSNNHVINPSVYAKMPFDSLEDITPIAVIGTTPIVLVVNPDKVPARNVPELIAFLKGKPGAYNYASSGNGTILHLAAEMFVGEAQVQVRHIPYKGVGPMVIDLVGGQVEWGMLALPSVQGHIRNGRLRALGVGGRSRVAAAPEIPTIAEQGLANYDAEGWFAVIGPAKLSAAQVKRLHGAFAAAFAAPEVREAMAKQGNAINLSTPEAAVQFFRSETAKYARLVKQAGVKID